MTEEPRNGAEDASDIKVEKERWRSLAASIPPTSPDESARITTTLHEVLRRQDWVVVLTFLAMPGEVDLGDLRNISRLTLAVTRTPPKGPLTIHSLEEPLELHPFGYLQPGMAGAWDMERVITTSCSRRSTPGPI